jgi:hypothetical protein
MAFPHSRRLETVAIALLQWLYAPVAMVHCFIIP